MPRRIPNLCLNLLSVHLEHGRQKFHSDRRHEVIAEFVGAEPRKQICFANPRFTKQDDYSSQRQRISGPRTLQQERGNEGLLTLANVPGRRSQVTHRFLTECYGLRGYFLEQAAVEKGTFLFSPRLAFSRASTARCARPGLHAKSFPVIAARHKAKSPAVCTPHRQARPPPPCPPGSGARDRLLPPSTARQSSIRA